MDDNKGAIVGGSILIGLGIALALVQFLGLSGSVVLLGLGIAFLAAWVMTKTYGLLVPGAILTGLGVGIALGEAGIAPESWSTLAGLGVGFLAIYFLDLLWSRSFKPSKGWWPLIPGGVILVVAVGSQVPGVFQALQYAWPIALIAVGAWIIWRGTKGRPHGHA